MYNPYQNNPFDMQNRMFSQPFMQKQEVIRVNGENGARALNLMPNSSALVLDENEPVVWLCQADGAGYKTVTPYAITPYIKKEPASVESLESRIAKLEEMINAKSNTRTVNAGKQQTATDESANVDAENKKPE